jgi:hypothetical protein
MPEFIYEGQSHSLRVSGRTLLRGRPTPLEGLAAENAAAYAAKHPELRELAGSDVTGKAGSSNPLAERQALVARAKELGIPAKGKSVELAAAIAAAEAAG